MKTIKPEELKLILENHQHWLNRDCVDWETMKADLRNADLYHADLRYADLRYADLRNSYLAYADLRDADLRYTSLYDSDIRGANLYHADLRSANLFYANLLRANLSNANLSDADLGRANLDGACLYNARLINANLCNASMKNAHFERANISHARIDRSSMNEVCPIACPEYGSFIGWKKANEKIIKLEITEDAKRSSAFSRKCRCDKARVVAIENADGTDSGINMIASSYDPSFVYTVGEIVCVDNFDENRCNECAPGIHFFITRQEAVNYY